MDIFGDYGLVVALSFVTLFIVLAFGIYSRLRVEKAKKKHEHSTLTQDPRMTSTDARPAEVNTAERR